MPILTAMIILTDIALLYLISGPELAVFALLSFPVVSILLDLLKFQFLHARNTDELIISDFHKISKAIALLEKNGLSTRRFKVFITMKPVSVPIYLGFSIIVVPRNYLLRFSDSPTALSAVIGQNIGHLKKGHSFVRNLILINTLVLALIISTVLTILIIVTALTISGIFRKKRSKLMTVIGTVLSGFICTISISKLKKTVPKFYNTILNSATHSLNCISDEFIASYGMARDMLMFLRENELSEVNYDRIQKLEKWL